jgi:hypothetical protein
MSRSGYVDDCDDQWMMIRWQGMLASSIRGKRGQKLLRELVEALEAMPVKRLIPNELHANGEVCALGAVGLKRGLDMSDIDPQDYEYVAAQFDIAEPLAREIVYRNDEYWEGVTPEERHARMLAWARSKLKENVPTQAVG